jgi:hypothetical protein
MLPLDPVALNPILTDAFVGTAPLYARLLATTVDSVNRCSPVDADADETGYDHARGQRPHDGPLRDLHVISSIIAERRLTLTRQTNAAGQRPKARLPVR